MPRQATGQVLERTTSRRGRVFALRFPAYGERRYVTLGTAAEGWSRKAAEAELDRVLAAVKLGIWRAPREKEEAGTDQAPAAPTFHEFAPEWFAARRGELS